MFAVGTVSQGEKHIESAGSGLIMCTGKRLAILCPVTICLQNIGLCQPAQWASPNMVRRHKPQHSKTVPMQSTPPVSHVCVATTAAGAINAWGTVLSLEAFGTPRSLFGRAASSRKS